MTVDVASLLELIEKASPAPWRPFGRATAIGADGDVAAGICERNQSLIVAAINALPELLAAYERSAQVLAAVKTIANDRDRAVELLHMLDRQEARHPDVAEFLDRFEEAQAAERAKPEGE